jgi:hypothetical protein
MVARMKTGIADTGIAWRAVLGMGLAALVLSGCSAHRLSQAQDAFSRAAEMENRLVQINTGRSLAGYATPFALYQQADGMLTKDTKDAKNDLAGDNLLATALALHAQTLWRLGDLAAVQTAQPDGVAADKLTFGKMSDDYRQRARDVRKAALEMKEQLGPRDGFLMEILPSLMEHDKGMHLVADGQWKRAHDFFASADKGLSDAVAAATTTPANHDARTYAVLARLQVLGGWNGAFAAGLTGLERQACQQTYLLERLKVVKEQGMALERARPKSGIEEFVRGRITEMGFDYKLDFGNAKLPQCQVS